MVVASHRASAHERVTERRLHLRLHRVSSEDIDLHPMESVGGR